LTEEDIYVISKKNIYIVTVIYIITMYFSLSLSKQSILFYF